MTTAIIWFSNNLRLHDNSILQHAISNHDCVLPLYIFESANYKNTAYGFPKTDSYRAQFIIDSVTNLKNNLQAIGGNLFVASDNSTTIFQQFLKEHSVTTIYFSKEYAAEEVKRQKIVMQQAKELGCRVITMEVATLVDADNLPFIISNMPDVFTAFRNQIEKHTEALKPLPSPTKINCLQLENWGSIPTIQELGLPTKKIDNRAAFQQQGGEKNALDFMHNYIWNLQLPATYFETRNQLIGTNYSTKLSAWLACGCISPRFVWQQVQAFEQQVIQNKSTYWIFFELLWRDFFRLQFAKHQQSYFLINGFRNDKIAPITFHEKYFMQWINGETGIDFVDANMKELQLTGFMSNRGRQNVASYLVNDLKMNWLAGAAYFESVLIDYDVYSNYGNWCYIAGVGNDPRQDRYFNITKQATMYDADGSYRKLWLS